MNRTADVVFDLLIALLSAALVSSVLILIYGQSPLRVYSLMMASTWGSTYGLGQVLFKATPLCLTGLAVAFAFRGGLFNIGAEGQMTAGAFVAGVAGAMCGSSLPGPIGVLVVVLCAGLAGGLVGALPGILKASRGSHEVIVTIMLNFIVSAIVLYLGKRTFFVEETTHTELLPEAMRLSSLGLGGSAANTSLLIAIMACVFVWIFNRYSLKGFDVLALGQNERAAKASGVPIGKTVVWTMTLSGALAGLAGVGFVLGHKHYFEEGMGRGMGFMGIAVALLGRNHPIGIFLAALLLGTLNHGGFAINHLVPREVVEVLQAVLIICVAITMASNSRRTS